MVIAIVSPTLIIIIIMCIYDWLFSLNDSDAHLNIFCIFDVNGFLFFTYFVLLYSIRMLECIQNFEHNEWNEISLNNDAENCRMFDMILCWRVEGHCKKDNKKARKLI